jgi:hypothetical protein
LITLLRMVARQFRVVLRRSLMALGPRGPTPLIRVCTGPDGLSLIAHHSDCTLFYHLLGPLPPDIIVFSARHLADFEAGRGTVNLEAVSFGKGRANWTDSGVPCTVEFETVVPESLPELPAQPEHVVDVSPDFLAALTEASQTAARDSSRFSLSHVQLRGSQGQVIATDGRQLLVQGGFAFPFSEDLLVPALPAFGCRELRSEAKVSIGHTDTHVALHIGPWTLCLATDTKARYPDTASVIPKPDGKVSRLQLSEEDSFFLSRALLKLPGKEEDLAPVTLDLGEQVVVRARAEGSQESSELILARSHCLGPAVRVAVDRRYLVRLVRLGFREVQLNGPTRPLLCQDDRRLYLFMPLDDKAALPPQENVFRIASDNLTTDPPTPKPQTERRITPVPRPDPPANGHSANGHPTTADPDRIPSLEELSRELDTLRASLAEISGRLAYLASHLKRHGRRGKVIEAALLRLKLP